MLHHIKLRKENITVGNQKACSCLSAGVQINMEKPIIQELKDSTLYGTLPCF